MPATVPGEGPGSCRGVIQRSLTNLTSKVTIKILLVINIMGSELTLPLFIPRNREAQIGHDLMLPVCRDD